MQNITFRVFKYRNFKLFFPGLIISQIGIWIQNVAINWLVYDITKSPLLTGASLFVSAIPFLIFTSIAGAIIDEFNKHKLLIAVQILFLIQSLVISVLFYSGNLNIPGIIIACFFLNLLLAIDAPLRQALFANIVRNKNDLTNAISINSSCFNLVKIIGPSISGLIIVNFGYGICFITTFLCILPNIALVALLKIKEQLKDGKKSVVKDFIEGIKYAVHDRKILYLQLFLAVFCFLVMIYPMLFPIYVKDVYSKNADILGFMVGMIGLGALCSSLMIASKKDNSNLKKIIIISCILLVICYILFGFVQNVKISLVLAFFMGLGVTGFITPQISILQSFIKNEFRGRIMSYNSFCILGITSVSTIVSGSIVELIGIKYTFLLYSILLFISTLFFSFKIKEN